MCDARAAAMSKIGSQMLFALVQSFFTNYLPRQRGASPHTTRAYRDTLKLLFQFVAQCRGREVAALVLEDLDADTIAAFLDHLEREDPTPPPRAAAVVPRFAASSNTSCAMISTMHSATRRCWRCRRSGRGRSPRPT
ncbi:site-specific integrase [Rhizobium beringeri]